MSASQASISRIHGPDSFILASGSGIAPVDVAAADMAAVWKPTSDTAAAPILEPSSHHFSLNHAPQQASSSSSATAMKGKPPYSHTLQRRVLEENVDCVVLGPRGLVTEEGKSTPAEASRTRTTDGRTQPFVVPDVPPFGV